MRITALQQQATNADRVNIFIDERFLMGASALIVMQLGLRIGQELSEAQLEQLRSDEELQQAVERALNYLSFRPRSQREVRDYLKRKNTSPEVIDAAMMRLQRLDLINDRNFASFWLETREQFSPKGARALKNELRVKGVEREIVDEVIDEEQDEERAQRAAEKKAYSLLRQPGIDYATFQRRLGSFLQRRGFGYDVTSRTVKQLWEKHEQEESAEE
jgi:regulatory protein